MYIVYVSSYRTWEFCFSQERTNFAQWNLKERHHLVLATPVDEMFDMSGISQRVCVFHTSVTSQYLIHSPTEASPPPGQLLSWTADSTCYRLWGHKSLLRLNKTWQKGSVPIQRRRFNIIFFLFTYSTFSPGQITFKNIKKEMSKGRTQHTEMHWGVQYLCACLKICQQILGLHTLWTTKYSRVTKTSWHKRNLTYERGAGLFTSDPKV